MFAKSDTWRHSSNPHHGEPGGGSQHQSRGGDGAAGRPAAEQAQGSG